MEENKIPTAKKYVVDWSKINDFEDFKKLFSTAFTIVLSENTEEFNDIKHFLKEKP